MTVETLSVERVTVPESIASPEARDFIDMIAVFNRGIEEDIGLDHLRWEPSEMLPAWREQRYVARGGHLVRRHGVAVGALQWSASLETGARNLEFDLLTTEEGRGHGIEALLLRRLLDDAQERGRTALQTFSIHRVDAPGERIASPTGYGSVPLDGWAAFFLDHGFTLQQVERNSMFDLRGSLDGVRRMLAEARAHADDLYRVHTWTGATPEEHREAFAYVLSRMSTDVPMGELDLPEETWDVERVIHRDRRLADSGLLIGVAAVEHVPTGRLVAYNELGIGEDRTRPTNQWGTLVTKEHRGHRLGTVVKCANLLRWAELVPTSPFVSTFNAEENRPMLDVNEAIGFVPLTVAGAWQRTLA
jgi:GNAT superfamily N-acetyltransferase